MRLGQEGTARQYDVVGARVLAEVLLARPTRGGMASVSTAERPEAMSDRDRSDGKVSLQKPRNSGF